MTDQFLEGEGGYSHGCMIRTLPVIMRLRVQFDVNCTSVFFERAQSCASLNGEQNLDCLMNTQVQIYSKLNEKPHDYRSKMHMKKLRSNQRTRVTITIYERKPLLETLSSIFARTSGNFPTLYRSYFIGSLCYKISLVNLEYFTRQEICTELPFFSTQLLFFCTIVP